MVPCSSVDSPCARTSRASAVAVVLITILKVKLSRAQSHSGKLRGCALSVQVVLESGMTLVYIYHLG